MESALWKKDGICLVELRAKTKKCLQEKRIYYKRTTCGLRLHIQYSCLKVSPSGPNSGYEFRTVYSTWWKDSFLSLSFESILFSIFYGYSCCCSNIRHHVIFMSERLASSYVPAKHARAFCFAAGRKPGFPTSYFFFLSLVDSLTTVIPRRYMEMLK